MSLKKSLCTKLVCSLSVAALLMVGNASAQVTVIPADEAKAILGQVDNGDNAAAARAVSEDPNHGIVVQAAEDLEPEDISDNYDVNALLVDIEMYAWNRLADLFDIVRCGIGGGCGIGAEAAVTKYGVFGAEYIPLERGVDFPHCIPPLWLLNYYDKSPVLNIHKTGDPAYATLAFLNARAENVPADLKQNYIFPREDWAIRAEIHALLLSAYVSVSGEEILDFFAGIIGMDPKGDDDVVDKDVTRAPFDQFGRGVCNIAFGAFEVPFNILRITEQEGDLPGISKGVLLGCWRCIVREVTGVVELVSFPFGWEPIIEPEYVFQRKRGVTWKVNRPAFHKKYNYSKR